MIFVYKKCDEKCRCRFLVHLELGFLVMVSDIDENDNFIHK